MSEAAYTLAKNILKIADEYQETSDKRALPIMLSYGELVLLASEVVRLHEEET